MSVSPDFCTGGAADPSLWKDWGFYCSYGDVVACEKDGTASFVTACAHGCESGECVMTGSAHLFSVSLSLLFLVWVLWWARRQ
jgi:hypothetical protein